jgi:site-specific DNA-methyltransferase (adenine-specific)
MDACADESNYKHENYYTIEKDGLKASWGGEIVFCNPPYSKKEKGKTGQEDWIEKAYKESSENGATVVMLIPARTDTKAFHDYILGKAQEIRFIKGRLKFEIDRKENKAAAPFPSMIVVFGGRVKETAVKAYTVKKCS